MSDAAMTMPDLRACRSRVPAGLLDADGIERALQTRGSGLLGDGIVARVRGMVRALASELSEACGRSAETLEAQLRAVPGLLPHLQALALERQLAVLQAVGSGDPLLPPLALRWVESGDGPLARIVRSWLAAEARYAESQRRMTLPLGDLPGPLFHAALALMADSGTLSAIKLRLRFNEGEARLGLAARLLLDAGPAAALSLDEAGPCLFASALALTSGRPRDEMVFAMAAAADGQGEALALVLRACGLRAEAMETQLALLHPAIPGMIGKLDAMSPTEAAALLAGEGAA